MSEFPRSPSIVARGDLARRTLFVLNRGGWGNPDVSLVESDGGPVVVKDFSPRGRWVRRWLAPRLLAREARAYRRLAEVEAVPKLIGRVDAEALVIEYRPGILLSRSLAGKLPERFLTDLECAVAEMHRRGIVHLDLRHRSNVLAGDDGRPVIIDFASSLRFDPTSIGGRLLLASFAWIDRRAVAKWRVRLEPASR